MKKLIVGEEDLKKYHRQKKMRDTPYVLPVE